MTQKPPSADEIRQWDDYWQHGFLTSCADAFDGNYAGTVATHWKSTVASLPSEAHVLDLCTGNGAVAALVAEESLAQNKSWHIHGIDLADIQPDKALGKSPQLLEAINFHPRTSASDLPFSANTFDAIVGQFALEYTPLKETVQEISRVAKNGCVLSFILHHPESVVLNTAAEELRNIAILFEESRLFESADALIEIVGSTSSPEERRQLASDPDAERARHQLNHSADLAARAIRDSNHPEILQIAMKYAQNAYQIALQGDIGKARNCLDAGNREIRANLDRLQDLKRAVLSSVELIQLIDRFKENGFIDIQQQKFFHGRHLLGWQLSAHKNI